MLRPRTLTCALLVQIDDHMQGRSRLHPPRRVQRSALLLNCDRQVGCRRRSLDVLCDVHVTTNINVHFQKAGQYNCDSHTNIQKHINYPALGSHWNYFDRSGVDEKVNTFHGLWPLTTVLIRAWFTRASQTQRQPTKVSFNSGLTFTFVIKQNTNNRATRNPSGCRMSCIEIRSSYLNQYFFLSF